MSGVHRLSPRCAWAGWARLLPLALALALAPGCGGRTTGQGSGTVTAPSFTTVRWPSVNKLDLLFMIDNSTSMADKQALLAQVVPELVDRLTNPIEVCTDSVGHATPANGQPCPAGSSGPTPEYQPASDIHIGVISSSLGGHGSPDNFCNPQAPGGSNPDNNDHGHLLPKVRAGLSSYQNLGFLDFDGTHGAEVKTDFTNYVTAAGEQGCGFESSLEAWYRFLADPAPPLDVKVTNNYSTPTGVDQEILYERAHFLRPDSLLFIVMLTDEDDCSISDTGLGWLVARQDHMPRATAACATDPNSPCCRSCALHESSPPPGCQAIKVDPSCNQGAFTNKEDALNLRCFQEKRRFGLDLLYPTQRYVNALTQRQLCPDNPDLSCGKNDTPEANPIFADLSQSGKIPRDRLLVFLAAITGVPWQDIATDDTLKDPSKLRYKTAAELGQEGIWDDIVGDVNKYIPPKDPLMQESIDPRSGKNPITGDAIAPPGAGVGANAENGHEYDIPGRDDLQYACIFPLATPRPNGVDCAQYGQPYASPNKPLCQNPTTGAYGTTQYFAKAYPGLRQLQVLKDFGDNSIVASICPKVATGSAADPVYGDNPAVDAILGRVAPLSDSYGRLDTLCLPHELTPDPATKQVACAVLEATPVSVGNTDCNKPGRAAPAYKLAAAARLTLGKEGLCGGSGQPDCTEMNLCQIEQLTDQTGLESCLQDDTVKAGVNGFCYVGGQQGNPAFIKSCPPDRHDLLRFVPVNVTPIPGATVLIACNWQ